jgi:molybdate transport system substrate-binding protein
VLASEAIDALARSGHVDAATRCVFARSSIAVAVASGAARPDVSSERAVREAVLDARTIGYSTGPSGRHLVRLLERWGVAQTVAPRLVQAMPGVPVASLVAAGDAAIGFQQLSELAGAPGVDVVGLLPEPIQATTAFTAAVGATSRDAAATRRLLAYLTSDATAEAKRGVGLQPP